MEEKLRQLMEKDEELLWIGRPEAFDTMDQSNKRPIIVGEIVKAVAFAALIIAYLIAAKHAGRVLPGVVIVLLIVAAYALASPFMTARALRNKAVYALTNRRLYRVGTTGEGYVDYDVIKTAAIRTDADGHQTLLCGPDALKTKPWRWRDLSTGSAALDMDTRECDRYVFYALPRDEKLMALLKEKLPL